MFNLNNFVVQSMLFMSLSVGAGCTKTELCDVLYKQQYGKEKIVISLVEGDITKQEFKDPEHAALVNAANSKLAIGAGVCGAIFKAAGPEKLTDACSKYLKGCPVGAAVTTSSCDIKDKHGAHYVIHAVGPQVVDELALFTTYYNTLVQADKHAITAIALPAISTGLFGYDVEDATPVALAAIMTYLKQHPATSVRDIRLVTFEQSKRRMLNRDLKDYWIYFLNLHKLVIRGMIQLKMNPEVDAAMAAEKAKKMPVSKPTMNFEVLVTHQPMKLNFISI